jgi:hypothetical protein
VPFDSYIFRDAVFVLATGAARDVIRAVGEKLGGNKEVYWRAAQSELITMHHDLVRDARQAAPRQAGPIQGRM